MTDRSVAKPVPAILRQTNSPYNFRIGAEELVQSPREHLLERFLAEEPKVAVGPVIGQHLPDARQVVSGEWQLVASAYNMKRLWRMQCIQEQAFSTG